MKLTIENCRKPHLLNLRHIHVMLALELCVMKTDVGGGTIAALEKVWDYEKSDNALKLVLGQLRRMGIVERITEHKGMPVPQKGQGVPAIYRFTADAAKRYGVGL